MRNNRKNVLESGSKKSNLFKKVTVEVLNERHNALARYLGIPCVVEANEVLESVAVDGVCAGNGGEFVCCKVELRHFKGEFAKVRFSAAASSKDMVLGFTVDRKGKVECVAAAKGAGTALVTLPLTKESDVLYVSVPAKNGKPKFANFSVELLGEKGVINEVNDALNSLLERIVALEESVASGYGADVEICLN